MICPKCGTENVDIAAFCRNCGTKLEKLPENDPVTEKPYVPVPEETPQDNYADFPAQSFAPQNELQSENNSTKKLTVIAGVIVAIIITIVVLLAVVSIISDNNNRSQSAKVYENYEQDYEDDNSSYEKEYEEVEETLSSEEYKSVPYELSQYADYLEEENNYYTVRLSKDDWNINVRSSPEYLTSSTEAVNNVIGLIPSGSEIYVEYIYNRAWAVIRMDGQYAFVAMYDFADPTRQQLVFRSDSY